MLLNPIIIPSQYWFEQPLTGIASELSCPDCSCQYVDLESYRLHLDFCPRTTIKKNRTLLTSLRQQRTSDLSSSNFCPVCEITMPCKEIFMKHLGDHLSGNFQCISQSRTLSWVLWRLYCHIHVYWHAKEKRAQ